MNREPASGTKTHTRPILRFKNLEWSYGERIILNRIEADIYPKNMISIIGPNGSGKTTLLRHIFRLLPASIGHVYLKSSDITQYSRRELAREAGLVPQNEKSNYQFTVYDLVKMGRYAHTGRFSRETDRDREVVNHAMAMTDIQEMRHKRATELSGGEFQRVIIARALAQEPELLVLDEPTSYLDPHHQIGIMNLLRKLIHEQDITVICTLHDLNHALAYSDQVILLDNGIIQNSGKPDEVITEKALWDTYKLKSRLIPNPLTGKLIIAMDC